MNYIINERNVMDGIELLSSIKEEISVCFFDPQYRGIMDKMNYGNEGVRMKKRYNLSQMNNDLIELFITKIDDVLKPSGHLFLWVDKFHLCEGIHDWINGTNLILVDMIIWNKMTMGMGYRSRRCSEFLLILQKKPKRVKGCWTRHDIRDIWNEKIEERNHPHKKPKGFIKALIEATSKENEFILDPCAGSYTVFDVCKEMNRNFIGCDLVA